MKRFLVLCAVVWTATAFVVGCDMKKKEAEVKTETQTTTPEGTTTETESHKVETNK